VEVGPRAGICTTTAANAALLARPSRSCLLLVLCCLYSPHQLLGLLILGECMEKGSFDVDKTELASLA
jgi:hypothetical protein